MTVRLNSPHRRKTKKAYKALAVHGNGFGEKGLTTVRGSFARAIANGVFKKRSAARFWFHLLQ